MLYSYKVALEFNEDDLEVNEEDLEVNEEDLLTDSYFLVK